MVMYLGLGLAWICAGLAIYEGTVDYIKCTKEFKEIQKSRKVGQ